ncbi:MAG: hypothetical protein RL717_961 [Pseudomonadota bacterium]
MSEFEDAHRARPHYLHFLMIFYRKLLDEHFLIRLVSHVG